MKGLPRTDLFYRTSGTVSIHMQRAPLVVVVEGSQEFIRGWGCVTDKQAEYKEINLLF